MGLERTHEKILRPNFIYYLSTILNDFKQVDFYGFNFCKDNFDNYATHYFIENQTQDERINRSYGHNFVKEAVFLKELVNTMKS